MNYFIFAITYAIAATLQPGPFQAYILSQTLTKGFKKTFHIAFAPIISDVPILTLIFILLTNLPPSFINILRIMGGLFLFYLSYKTFLTWKNYSQAEIIDSSISTFFNAVLVNLLNPNPYIGWSLIMGPTVLEIWEKSPVIAISFVLCFYFTIVVGTMGIILLFSYTRSMGPKISRALLGVSAIGLFIFGSFQIYRAFLN